MLVRMAVVAAGLVCCAPALAGNAASDAIPAPRPSAAAVHQPAAERSTPAGADARAITAPVFPGSGAPDALAQPVSFGRQPAGRFPTAPVAGDSPERSDDAAREDALNAPFWVFLLWYMGSR